MVGHKNALLRICMASSSSFIFTLPATNASGTFLSLLLPHFHVTGKINCVELEKEEFLDMLNELPFPNTHLCSTAETDLLHLAHHE